MKRFKSFLTNFTIAIFDVVFFGLLIVIFIMGSSLNTLVSSNVTAKISVHDASSEVWAFIVLKLAQYLVISISGYLSSLVTTLMIYFDEYLIGTDNLDEPHPPIDFTKILFYVGGVFGVFFICFLYSTKNVVMSAHDLHYLFDLNEIFTNFESNVLVWKKDSAFIAIASGISLLIEVGIFSFFYLYKPICALKNKKTRLFW